MQHIMQKKKESFRLEIRRKQMNVCYQQKRNQIINKIQLTQEVCGLIEELAVDKLLDLYKEKKVHVQQVLFENLSQLEAKVIGCLNSQITDDKANKLMQLVALAYQLYESKSINISLQFLQVLVQFTQTYQSYQQFYSILLAINPKYFQLEELKVLQKISMKSFYRFGEHFLQFLFNITLMKDNQMMAQYFDQYFNETTVPQILKHLIDMSVVLLLIMNLTAQSAKISAVLVEQGLLEKIKFHLEFGNWNDRKFAYNIVQNLLDDQELRQSVRECGMMGDIIRRIKQNSEHSKVEETLFLTFIKYTYYLEETEEIKHFNENQCLELVVSLFDRNPTKEIKIGILNVLNHLVLLGERLKGEHQTSQNTYLIYIDALGIQDQLQKVYQQDKVECEIAEFLLECLAHKYYK